MLSTREEIKSALEEYCSYIAANNRRALETLIPIIANWVPKEGSEFDDVPEDQVPRFRLKSLRHLVDNWGVIWRWSDPTELLTRWDELAPLVDLDGVIRLRTPGPESEMDIDGQRYPLQVLADKGFRELKFNEYVTAVETALGDRLLEEARDTVAFPEELRILFEFGVDGLSGYGLPIWHEEGCGCHFWIGLGQEPVEDVVSRVQGPDSEMDSWGVTIRDCFALAPGPGDEPGEWVIAGGWGIGYGHDTQKCCAVFCRRADEKGFAWRYAISCEYDERVFDTIPQLLDYYKEFDQGSFDHRVQNNANEEYLFMPSQF